MRLFMAINFTAETRGKLISLREELRSRSQRGREVVWKVIGDFSSFIDINFSKIEETVTGIELMKSERVGGKLTYSAIFEKRGQESEIIP